MKNKRIEIRVSEDFYQLLDGLCRKYECSKTDYIINHCLFKEINIVKYEDVDAPETKDAFRKIASIANNMNQVGRSINAICIEVRNTIDKNIIVENQSFADMAAKFQQAHLEFKDLNRKFNEEYIKIVQMTQTKMIDEDVQEYLERTDPDYLELLKSGEIEN